jgi:hypothetical protein
MYRQRLKIHHLHQSNSLSHHCLLLLAVRQKSGADAYVQRVLET